MQYLSRYQDDRITPACAGKSVFLHALHNTGKDHPRVCGEKTIITQSTISAIGSPPRVRGKDSQTPTFSVLSRITPACAGKSKETDDTPFCPQDHPRVCGEKAAGYSLEVKT